MARSIAVDASEAWRAVIVFKGKEGNLWYRYEGIYNSKGIAKGRVTWWSSSVQFYDGWIERAEITWEKLKD